jgi:hypothetical protein
MNRLGRIGYRGLEIYRAVSICTNLALWRRRTPLDMCLCVCGAQEIAANNTPQHSPMNRAIIETNVTNED